MKRIKLTQGYVALVDDDDFVKVCQFKWYASNQSGKWYARRSISVPKGTMSMHSFIMNTPHGLDTDHINHDTLDNRKKNLRVVTRTQNLMNRKLLKNNLSSGFTGVTWFKRSKLWRVYIKVGAKNKHLGYFKVKEDAIQARIKAEKIYFGEYAFKR